MKSYNIHAWALPPLYEKHFSTDLRKSQAGFCTEVVGSGPTHYPRGDANECVPMQTQREFNLQRVNLFQDTDSVHLALLAHAGASQMDVTVTCNKMSPFKLNLRVCRENIDLLAGYMVTNSSCMIVNRLKYVARPHVIEIHSVSDCKMRMENIGAAHSAQTPLILIFTQMSVCLLLLRRVTSGPIYIRSQPVLSGSNQSVFILYWTGISCARVLDSETISPVVLVSIPTSASKCHLSTVQSLTTNVIKTPCCHAAFELTHRSQQRHLN